MTTMNTNIENQICDAIQILAERAINQAPYDKTIPALIVECVDTKKGKYKVKYQDAFYYATSDNTELNYRKNTEVYILVPGNDFTKEKKILGTVKDMEDEYNDMLNDKLNFYHEVGKGINCYGGELCSYNKEQTVILGNEFEVDSSFKDNLRFYGSRLRLSADIKTALPPEHRLNNGYYGISAKLRFLDEETKQSMLYTFTLDIDNMIGNPYGFGTPIRQFLDFDINGRHFEAIEEIKIFCRSFVEETPEDIDNKQNNIFISNIQITALSSKEHGYLKIDALNGYVLDDEKQTELIFKATPMLGSNEIKAEKINFYWFCEDGSINTDNKLYSSIGGKGWQWLNKDNLINNITITNQNQIAKKLKYKCIAVLEKERYEESFYVEYKNGVETVDLYADPAITEFIQDRGKVNLICRVNESEKEEDLTNYSFYWSKTDDSGVITILKPENGDAEQIINEVGKDNLAVRNSLVALINRVKALTPTNKFSAGSDGNILDKLGISYKNLSNDKVLNNVESYLNNIGITCIENNVFYDVLAKNIVISSTYKCTIKKDNLIAGTAEIKLINTRLSQNNYTIKIDNGTQVFKYDINGRAPKSTSLESNIVEKELSVHLYDKNGNEISKEAYTVDWIIPSSATLLENVKENEKDNTKLTFTVKNVYNTKYVNNDIVANVIYKGELIKGETNFTFIKEGFSGTNGTDYYCKIVPNGQEFIDNYTFITYYKDSGKLYLNTTPSRIQLTANQANPFKVHLYNGGERIAANLSAKWKLLDNIANASNFKPIDISGSGQGTFTFDTSLSNLNGNYIGVIQAEVSYENKTFFAELPIGLVIMESGYSDDYILEIEEGTGFNEVIYTSDGTNPQYHFAEPFTIYATAAPDEDGFVEDISKTLTSYSWSRKSKELELKDTDEPYSYKATPIKQYDGLSSDIFIKCQTNIGTIFFPILFRLNRYGFSALNDWDGKGIKINEDENYILSPQIGAGKKDNKNRFTGVLMGVMKESNGNEDIGLLGFNEGERTIFLDSQTGDAHFGRVSSKAGISLYGSTGIAELKGAGGSIILNPSKENEGVVIKSDIYSTTNKTGLMINFSKPEIKFGSGKFEVNSDGEIKSTAGSIGGWTINATSISSQPKGKKLTLVQSQAGGDYAFVAGADSSSTVSKAPFYVKHDGTLKATQATIEGKITATSGSFTGTITASEGKIGNWTISSGAITNGVTELKADGSFKSGNFSVSKAGAISATGGTFTNITVTGSSSFSGSLSGATGTFAGNLSAAGGTFSGTLKAASGSFSGTITAGAGSIIGGWSIGAKTLSSGQISLTANGSDSSIVCGKTTIFDGGTIRTPYMQVSPTQGIMVGNGSGSYEACPAEIRLQQKAKIVIGAGGFETTIERPVTLIFRRGLLVDYSW